MVKIWICQDKKILIKFKEAFNPYFSSDVKFILEQDCGNVEYPLEFKTSNDETALSTLSIKKTAGF